MDLKQWFKRMARPFRKGLFFMEAKRHLKEFYQDVILGKPKKNRRMMKAKLAKQAYKQTNGVPASAR